MSKNTNQTVTLNYPITWEGAKIAEVTVKRPKVKDMKAVEEVEEGLGDISRSIAVIAILTGLPSEAVEELDAKDFEAVSEVIGGFLGRATPPPSGGAS